MPVDDDTLIEAATAVYAESAEAEAWESWEPAGSLHRGDGLVDLDVCVWDGVSVDNLVRTARVQLDGVTADSLGGTVLSEFVGPGDCVSTAMIESALGFLEAYVAENAKMVEAPSTFAVGPWADLMTERLFAQASENRAQQAADGLYWVSSTPPGVAYPDDLDEPVAWRVQPDSYAGRALELAMCLQMNPDYGLYRNGERLEGAQGDSLHTQLIVLYQLVLDADGLWTWRLADTDGSTWGDCDRGSSWLENVRAWQSDGPDWQLWQPDAAR